ncbi:putative processing peptidase [Helianthus annuus]|uniref:Processing peptidase n=1 Tax=Helianthus annuus TaxID=4232 RepID=A0A9K3HWB7_HELAN|nr:putative processing peptidase [Helianthus annuus]KAJ0513035.1 putative processing peptidase [Helianthus annuus]KAJ0529155.1 putative processing peptidase [Helianthus annuus]KAJ0878601.1 putative processing peptidase [Helianthus annuus]
MKHETETKSNAYWLGLISHLQAASIHRKDISCITDMTMLYEDATIEDVYLVYEQLKIDDQSLYCCIAIASAKPDDEIHIAVDACKNVLRGLHSKKIADHELDRAKRTLLMKHETETKSNAYWLGLISHLRAASIYRKDISCIKDMTMLYEAATIEDVYLAYEQLKIDDQSLYCCIGIVGAKADDDVYI